MIGLMKIMPVIDSVMEFFMPCQKKDQIHHLASVLMDFTGV